MTRGQRVEVTFNLALVVMAVALAAWAIVGHLAEDEVALKQATVQVEAASLPVQSLTVAYIERLDYGPKSGLVYAEFNNGASYEFVPCTTGVEEDCFLDEAGIVLDGTLFEIEVP